LFKKSTIQKVNKEKDPSLEKPDQERIRQPTNVLAM
jgi:hypothetical protein